MLCQQDLLNFHDRPIVYLSCSNGVVYKAKADHTNSSYYAEVHSLDSNSPRGRPEAEENCNSHVDESKGIDQDAPNTWQMEWAPDKLRADSVDNCRVAASGIADATRAASVEEQTSDDHVR